MNFNYTTYRLKCIHPFGISRSTFDYYDRVFVYLAQDGFIGRGEAAPTERYNESIPQIVERLEKGIHIPKIISSIDEIIEVIDTQFDGIKSFRSALVNAALDWWTQKQGQTLYQYFGFERVITKPTSFTIAIGDFGELEQKIIEAEPYHILKVKLGSDDDKKIITEIRKYTNKPIWIDANEGWDLKTAIEMSNWLAMQNVELIEQPLPEKDLEQMVELKKYSSLPLIADENCHTSNDITKLANGFDGINIKLTKCGGLDEAVKMIELARQFKLKIMFGCMVESSIGITALAHLVSQADYLDLDGNLLIDNDPYTGMQIVNGIPILPKGKGLGLSLKNNYRNEFPELK